MQIRYLGKVEHLEIAFTGRPYVFEPGQATDVDDPDDQQTLLAYPTSFERVVAAPVEQVVDRDSALPGPLEPPRGDGMPAGVVGDEDLEDAEAPTPRKEGRRRRGNAP